MLWIWLRDCAVEIAGLQRRPTSTQQKATKQPKIAKPQKTLPHREIASTTRFKALASQNPEDA
jgi:hypothetical protein